MQCSHDIWQTQSEFILRVYHATASPKPNPHYLKMLNRLGGHQQWNNQCHTVLPGKGKSCAQAGVVSKGKSKPQQGRAETSR